MRSAACLALLLAIVTAALVPARAETLLVRELALALLFRAAALLVNELAMVRGVRGQDDFGRGLAAAISRRVRGMLVDDIFQEFGYVLPFLALCRGLVVVKISRVALVIRRRTAHA